MIFSQFFQSNWHFHMAFNKSFLSNTNLHARSNTSLMAHAPLICTPALMCESILCTYTQSTSLKRNVSHFASKSPVLSADRLCLLARHHIQLLLLLYSVMAWFYYVLSKQHMLHKNFLICCPLLFYFYVQHFLFNDNIIM